MSSRPDLSSSSTKDFRPGSSRFRGSAATSSASATSSTVAPPVTAVPVRCVATTTTTHHHHHHHHHYHYHYHYHYHHLPPVSGRQLNSPKLSKRFSSAASSTQSAAVATGSTSTSSSSSQSNSRSSAKGGLMAGAATSSTEPPISFCLPDANWQKSKARLLGLSVQEIHWFSSIPPTISSITAASPRNCRHKFPCDTPPRTCEVVAGDGNCLFRALSFWITGSEDFHIEVRDAIVEEIKSNARLYSAVTPNHSITNYLRESQMSEEGVWGSEVEICVAATLLQTPVAVYPAFGDRHLWKVFRPLQYTEPRERFIMLYLQNSNNLFEPVIDV